MSDTKFATGAVRSADADKFSFTSLPMIGLLALARTAGEGAEKYGRFNYLQGMPIHDLLEHTFKHLIMYNAGDRSEPHLAHAAWGLLVAIQEEVLRPEAHVPHMLGAGCSITPAIQAHMDEQKPILAKRRAESDPDAFTWNIFDLADVRKLRDQRDGVNATKLQLGLNEAERQALKTAILNAPPGELQSLPSETVIGFLGARARKLEPFKDSDTINWHHVDDEGFVVLPASSGNPTVDAWAKQQRLEHVQGEPTILRTPSEAIAEERRGQIRNGYDPASRTMDGVPVVDKLGTTPQATHYATNSDGTMELQYMRPVKPGRAVGNPEIRERKSGREFVDNFNGERDVY